MPYYCSGSRRDWTNGASWEYASKPDGEAARLLRLLRWEFDNNAAIRRMLHSTLQRMLAHAIAKSMVCSLDSLLWNVIDITYEKSCDAPPGSATWMTLPEPIVKPEFEATRPAFLFSDWLDYIDKNAYSVANLTSHFMDFVALNNESEGCYESPTVIKPSQKEENPNVESQSPKKDIKQRPGVVEILAKDHRHVQFDLHAMAAERVQQLESSGVKETDRSKPTSAQHTGDKKDTKELNKGTSGTKEKVAQTKGQQHSSTKETGEKDTTEHKKGNSSIKEKVTQPHGQQLSSNKETDKKDCKKQPADIDNPQPTHQPSQYDNIDSLNRHLRWAWRLHMQSSNLNALAECNPWYVPLPDGFKWGWGGAHLGDRDSVELLLEGVHFSQKKADDGCSFADLYVPKWAVKTNENPRYLAAVKAKWLERMWRAYGLLWAWSEKVKEEGRILNLLDYLEDRSNLSKYGLTKPDDNVAAVLAAVNMRLHLTAQGQSDKATSKRDETSTGDIKGSMPGSYIW